MAVRKIIHIDEEKCDGCGDCVPSCAEGAIQIIDGKAKVVSETYCDGLGACLGECPQDAITMIEREAADYDEEAVEKHLKKLGEKPSSPLPIIGAAELSAPKQGGCPGSAMRNFNQPQQAPPVADRSNMASALKHWPIQLMLVPPHAPFLKEADILVCADCVPFTVPDFHSRYLAERALVVGCPKLDDLQHYFEKFKEIIKEAAPKKLTVLKMEVPCCAGIGQAVIQARDEVAPEIPVEVVTIGIQGGSISEKIDNRQVG
ncbi:MAG: 4Fe-4S binding protein [candidate division Zixibacteria bacterium]|nr:4Fe-4S binding protein [candidate division Zixibacteria bacterium]